MAYDTEKLLMLISDMEDMINSNDALSETISNSKRKNIELSEEELDLISAARNIDFNNDNKKI